MTKRKKTREDFVALAKTLPPLDETVLATRTQPLDDGGAIGTGKGSARGYTREASQRAADGAAAKRGQFVVHTTSRQDGRALGPVIYVFTVESQKTGFLAGHWPLPKP